jgi:hypothetical protein
MFKNEALRRIFEPEKQEVTGGIGKIAWREAL